ncbi:MAG: hypothetical protein ABI822_27475, partial [Bryobacteraceae bacterium]
MDSTIEAWLLSAARSVAPVHGETALIDLNGESGVDLPGSRVEGSRFVLTSYRSKNMAILRKDPSCIRMIFTD